MTRPTQRQIEQFEAKLHKATRNSVEVSDTLLRKLAERRDAYLSNLRWILIMNSTIYRVEGYYASGRFVSHLVGATDANHAIDSVTNADNRIIRITSAKPTLLH